MKKKVKKHTETISVDAPAFTETQEVNTNSVQTNLADTFIHPDTGKKRLSAKNAFIPSIMFIYEYILYAYI